MTSMFSMTYMVASTAMCGKGALGVCALVSLSRPCDRLTPPSGRSHGLHRSRYSS